jgi:hypothetical protein
LLKEGSEEKQSKESVWSVVGILREVRQLTETLNFTNLNLNLPLVLDEIKNIVQAGGLEIQEESSGTDKEGHPFLSLHAQLPDSQSTMEKVKKVARAVFGAQRDLIVVIRGDPQAFTVELAMGKMTENILASGLTGLVLLGPLGLVLSPTSFGFAVKYEKDLAGKIATAIETLARAQTHFAGKSASE